MIVSGLYLVLFFLSIIALNRLFKNMANRRGTYYAILFTLISVVCLAYFSYSISLDASMALVSNQFTYLDGTFIMMFFIFCILDIMGIRIKNYVAIPWSLCGVFFLLIPFSAGHNGMFYESYYFKQDLGASHLVMEFGPWHGPFMAYVIINTLLPIVVVTVSFFMKRKISYKISLVLSGLLVAVISIHFVEQIIGLPFDLLPVGYVLIEYVVLGIVRHVGLYDANKIALDSADESKEYGCIIFDTKKYFMGANDNARFYFPELEKLSIDRAVDDEFIINEFVSWIGDGQNVPSKVIERNGKKLLCTEKIYVIKNKIYGYIIELRDDTEQQNLIEQLNETNEELAQTVEIANNANKAKSQFLANMSHEIRTPINAILGMNELAMRKCTDSELKEYMQEIEAAGHSLLGIINDILDFSKIEAGKVDIILDEYELARLIKEVADIIRIRAEQKSLNFSVNVDENLPSVLLGDENRIRQIMINILNNAVKYTHEGNITLDVSCANRSGDNFEFVIKVSDTGIGIHEEDLKILFESFSRVDQKKNRSVEGTGLGLAITNKLVRLMDGDISVSSVYGEGSEFLVIIPQKIVDEKPIGDYKESSKNITAEKEIVNVDATGNNILVVDDNLINLKIVEGLLETTNANITLSDNGPEAVELMMNNKYDIVLLDHMMPEMDGLEVLDTIKNKNDALSHDSTFIVLTANAISGVKDEYTEAGFDDYLSKPIDPVLFIKTIGKYVKNEA